MCILVHWRTSEPYWRTFRVRVRQLVHSDQILDASLLILGPWLWFSRSWESQKSNLVTGQYLQKFPSYLREGTCLGSGQVPIDYGVDTLNFEVIGCKTIKYHFQHYNSKTITFINLNLGADTQAKSRKMNLQWASGISHIDFTLCLWGDGHILACLAVLFLALVTCITKIYWRWVP